MAEDYLSQTTYRAGILQSRAYRAMTNFMANYLADYQLSKPEWMLIGCLLEEHKLRPTDAAELLGVRPPVATKLIRSLEDKKLVQIIADRRDRRVSHLRLSKLGLKKAEEIEGRLRVEMAKWLQSVDKQKLNTYLGVMEQIAHL